MSEETQANEIAPLTNAERESLMASCDNDTWDDHIAHVAELVAAARADERERIAALLNDLLAERDERRAEYKVGDFGMVTRDQHLGFTAGIGEAAARLAHVLRDRDYPPAPTTGTGGRDE